MVTIPDDNIVFVGNMLQAPPPAFPWLFEGNAEAAVATYERLYKALDNEVAIVPGHGRTMRRADIRFSIEYLQELKIQVNNAAANGLTEEQVREQIVMGRYAEYSLYDGIHLGVNVPTLMAEAQS